MGSSDAPTKRLRFFQRGATVRGLEICASNLEAQLGNADCFRARAQNDVAALFPERVECTNTFLGPVQI